LILFSDQIELYIPPKKAGHVLRIIRELIEFEPKVLNDIAQALKFLSSTQKKRLYLLSLILWQRL
jgi:hypothetical protein